ncbi:MAG TPA: hypothetical protein VN408_25720 [Actinoplanes sp.]|nr:hypothetical protein [Actinoplanes sp.]
MTPARSVAASVVALGFAGTLTAPLPALAAPGCAKPERYAAQSGAELLRIDRLDLEPGGRIADSRTKTSSGTGDQGADSDTDQDDVLDDSTDDSDSPDAVVPAPPAESPSGGQGGGAAAPDISDVGLGHTRSVLIAGAPVSSAGAARVLNGKVAGSTTRNELVVQQAPPVQPKAAEQRTAAKRYGPVDVGSGSLRARAVWTPGMGCGAADREVSMASTELSRVTVTGGGNGALIRTAEKITSRSGTALQDKTAVATATVTAGRISLVDNEVRIRMLRAPQLTVSVPASGKGRVDYRPAIVEITTKGGKTARLDTGGEYVDITLSDDLRPLEAARSRLVPDGDLPLPKVPGLPALSEIENTPVPAGADGPLMRISLGAVRQATDGEAIAAAATALRVTVIHKDSNSDSQPSGVVADLGIGMLQAAAVAPNANRGKGRPGAGSGGGTRPGAGSNAGADAGDGFGNGVGSGPGDGFADGSGSSSGSSSGSGFGDSGLPITGPRAVSFGLAGVALLLGGISAVVLTSRRRRRHQP